MPSGVPIRTVKVLQKVEKPFKVERIGHPTRYYMCQATDHHMEILKEDKTGNWLGVCVPNHEAARRVRPHKGDAAMPIVCKDHGPGKTFVPSLAEGETIFSRRQDRSAEPSRYYVVSKLEKNRIHFQPVNDARPVKDKKIPRIVRTAGASLLQDLSLSVPKRTSRRTRCALARLASWSACTMIKEVFELSQYAADVSARDGQLKFRFQDGGREPVTVPCEDLGFLIVDNPAVNYSHHALCELIANGAAVVLCGRNHLPAGLLLPLPNHTEITARLREQISLRAPLRKRLWQQLVIAKIRAQAINLFSTDAAGHLRALARQVRSGDPKNVEAQAAKAYWRAWRPESAAEFRRDPDAAEPLNAMLNYGYAVMRAAVARALVSSGLNPTSGIHHANRSNAFCLADDLMEPLRPLVDARVRNLHEKGEHTLSPSG